MTADLLQALEATFGTDGAAVATRSAGFGAAAAVEMVEHQVVEA